MQLSLKSLKIHADMSEETTCFSATIYANGKKAGTVRNEGRGGSHNYYWENPSLGQEIEKWANQQPTEFDFDKIGQIIDNLVMNADILASLKRRTKNVTWFRLKGDAPKDWRIVKAPFTPAVKTFLTNKYPNIEIIANENLEEAIPYC
jgi:hypothetical protein